MIDGKKLTNMFLDNICKRHSLIVGMTRSGKTFLCKHILEALQDKNVHTIFFDPKHDDEFSSLGIICRTPMEFYSQILKKTPNIVYRPPGDRTTRQGSLTEIIDIVFRVSRNPKFSRIKRVIAIDEIQLVVKKGGHDGVEQLWTVGAGMGIVGLAITQRVQLLNETVWSQSENRMLFKVEDRQDYLKSRNLDEFAGLRDFFIDPTHQYWFYYTDGGGVWRKHPPVLGREKYAGRLRLSRW